jgi:elongation factor G
MATLAGRAAKRQEMAGVAAVQAFSFMDEPWAALDFAGGPENLAQAGPSLAASDAAVICVPADAGAAVLAAPYMRAVEEAGIPAFLFVNRIDQAGSRVSEIVGALQAYCRHNLILRQVPMRQGEEIVGAVDLISERAWKYQEGQHSALVELPKSDAAREQEARAELLEALSDFDDHLLEQLIEDQAPLADEVYDVATKVLQHNDLIPVFLGAAEHCNGVHRLLKSLRHEAPGIDETRSRLGGDVVAVGCRGDQVKHLGKTVLVRALQDGVGTNGQIGGESIGSLTPVAGAANGGALAAGELGVAAKADHLTLGCSYSEAASAPLPDWVRARPSMHRRIVVPVHEKDEARLSGALERIGEIDAALEISQDVQSGHTVLNAQGPLHQRRVLSVLAEGFGIEVEEEPMPAQLRETVTKPVEVRHRHRKQSGGAGQFADVVITLSPQARGSGFAFSESVKGGAVPRNYIPSVEAGAQDALGAGPKGYPVVDVSVELKDGKHHSVDSSDYAFRTAGKNAVREALDQAGAILLQPIMRVHMHIPSDFTGGLVPVVSGMKGQIIGFDAHPEAAGWDVFEALLPMVALDDLSTSLASATRGTGWFDAEFDHYQEARQAEFA